MKLLGIIPARGGSKGIPGKNIKMLGGKPLLAYTAEAALNSGIFDRVILSTEDEEIANVGRSLGLEIPFMRPADLARDETPMLPVLRHAIERLQAEGWQADALVILQPTSPFRQVRDLQKACSILRDNPSIDSVVAVEPVPEHYSPYFVMRIESERLLPFMTDGLRFTRRQDAPRAYSRSGDFYFTRTRVLTEENSIYGTNCHPFIVNHPNRVNLDNLDDWAKAEKLINDSASAR